MTPTNARDCLLVVLPSSQLVPLGHRRHMKVLQVIHGFLPQFRGGTELYAYKMMRELRALGHEVEIVTGTTDTADEPRIDTYDYDGFRVWKIVQSGSYLEHWTRSLSPNAAAMFEEVLRRSHPDLVHVQHWYRLTRNLIEIARGQDIPAVCTLHDLWTSCPRIFRIRDESFCERPLGAESCTDCVPRLPWMDDATSAEGVDLFRADFESELRLAERIIVPSAAHGEAVAHMLDIPAKRVRVLPHGTIAPPITPAGGREPGKRQGIRLGMWGHLFHMKGAHLVLEALQKLRGRREFDVHIWGQVVEPKYRRRLDELSDGLEVTWHGAFEPKDVAEVPLDLAVIPSLCSESFSFVLDEAFRLGLPAVVSDRGALGERIGSAGCTFEPESADDLARVLGDVLKRPQVIDEWRDHIPELQDMRDHTRELARIYRDVVRKGSSDRRLDPTLPRLRERHQASVVARYEDLMFGYLGHIKRESGRGDHYEGVVKKMIDEQHEFGRRINELTDARSTLDKEATNKRQLVDVLAREVLDFRRTLEEVDAEKPSLVRELPAPTEVDEHVPGLGSAPSIVEGNQDAMALFVSRLESLKTQTRARTAAEEAKEKREEAERRALVELLAGEILTFREAVSRIDGDKPVYGRRQAERSSLDVDVAGLGAPSTFLDVDHELLSTFSERIAAWHKRLEEQDLAAERLRGEMAEMRGQLTDTRGELTQAQAEAEKGATVQSGLTTELKDLTARLTASDERTTEVTAQCEAATAKLEEAEEKIEEFELLAFEAKEERGRYERVVVVLGGMVHTFRRVLEKITHPSPSYMDSSFGLARELRDIDIANLGKVGEAIVRNTDLIEKFIGNVKQLRGEADAARAAQAKIEQFEEDLEEATTDLEAARAEVKEKSETISSLSAAIEEKDRMIACLGAMVEDMRRALTAIHQDEPSFESAVQTTDGIDAHVPNLGDLATIHATNQKLIEEHVDAVRRMRSDEASEEPPAEDAKPADGGE